MIVGGKKSLPATEESADVPGGCEAVEAHAEVRPRALPGAVFIATKNTWTRHFTEHKRDRLKARGMWIRLDASSDSFEFDRPRVSRGRISNGGGVRCIRDAGCGGRACGSFRSAARAQEVGRARGDREGGSCETACEIFPGASASERERALRAWTSFAGAERTGKPHYLRTTEQKREAASSIPEPTTSSPCKPEEALASLALRVLRVARSIPKVLSHNPIAPRLTLLEAIAAHLSENDPLLILHQHFLKQLVSPNFWPTLPCFTGVQLHDFIPGGPSRFPGFVTDFDGTLQWLGRMLDPWVQLFTGSSTDTIFVSSDARSKYRKTIHYFDGVPAAPPRPATLKAESFTSIGFMPPQLSAPDIISQLGTRGPAWPDVDATGVTFPLGYPPAPPRLAELDSVALAAAMTDAGYHLESGPDFTPNTGYHHLGLRLCKIAVTMLTYKKFYSATPAEMVTILTIATYGGRLHASPGAQAYRKHEEERAQKKAAAIAAKEIEAACRIVVGRKKRLQSEQDKGSHKKAAAIQTKKMQIARPARAASVSNKQG
ncbi:hypothetical protein C8R47DRAFT_1083397 [Mycena vitilis]|nr:hypothetical protein C8R47DRAFT_1083397 [Mycena vitilis]